MKTTCEKPTILLEYIRIRATVNEIQSKIFYLLYNNVILTKTVYLHFEAKMRNGTIFSHKSKSYLRFFYNRVQGWVYLYRAAINRMIGRGLEQKMYKAWEGSGTCLGKRGEN